MERDALSQPMAAAVNASLFDREAEQGKGRLPRRPSRNKQEDVCPPLPPECSFKPRIIDYEKVTQRPRPPRAEMLARLAAPRSDHHSERARLRAEREREEMAACTFQPQLCEGTKRRAAKASMTSAPPLPLLDRLQQRQLEVERRRRRRQLELQEAEMAPCSFTPHISPAAATLVRQSPPLHERLGQVQRERRERLASLKARLEAETDGGNGCCCPSISALSEQLARGSDCSLDGAEGGEDGEMADAWGERRMQEQGAGARGQQSRMQREAQRREQQRMQRLWEHEQQQAAACSFAPRLSVGTRQLLADNPRFVQLGFLERQTLLDAEAARRRQDEEARQEEERALWFRPAITAFAKQHQHQEEKGQGQERETPTERARRLSVEEAARREEARARRTEEYYAGVATFRPALNPVSQALGRAAASVDELVYDCRREEARSRAAEDAEARLREACAFQPAVASSAVRARSSGCPRARRRQAQELARQAQVEREREEAEACTFRPDTRASRRSFEKVAGATAGTSAHPIVVPGLGSFLARHKLAERQQRERERAMARWARR